MTMWLDIKDAPRDGTEILVNRNSLVGIVYASIKYDTENNCWEECLLNCEVLEDDIKGWIPMPKEKE